MSTEPERTLAGGGASGGSISGTLNVWPDGYDLVVLDQVDSTLNEAARRAPEMPGPTWIMAHRQTAARGRRGRAWQNPEGNLAATLVMYPDGGPAQSALRSFVAALALFDACVAVTGQSARFSLKWPNDVLLDEGKLAGILLESQAGPRPVLSIGIGVNLATAPESGTLEGRALAPRALCDAGAECDPETFLRALAAAFAQWESRFQLHGFEPVRRAWLDRAARLGDVIIARTGTDETTGRFETVDGQGNLVLETSGGRVSIPAADVYF